MVETYYLASYSLEINPSEYLNDLRRIRAAAPVQIIKQPKKTVVDRDTSGIYLSCKNNLSEKSHFRHRNISYVA